MAVTLKDLAKSLNISVSTVNAALYNRSDISVATRKRVWEKAQEMHYRPNLLARSLVTRKTHVIGVVVPDLSRSFFTEVIKGIEEAASSADYNLLICNTNENPERERSQLATLVGKQVDGLLLASAVRPGSTELHEQLSTLGVPCVLLDRFFAREHFVGGDDVRIGYIATEHLIEQGYHRIAHVRGPYLSTSLGRMKGYRKALRKHGMTSRESYIVEAMYHEESSGAMAVSKLLRVSQPPDAIFASSDAIAIGVLGELLRMGLQVPGEIGVVGVGNHPYGEYLRVALTTVDQNRVDIGRKATVLLIDLMGGGYKGEHRIIFIEPRLILRASSSHKFR